MYRRNPAIQVADLIQRLPARVAWRWVGMNLLLTGLIALISNSPEHMFAYERVDTDPGRSSIIAPWKFDQDSVGAQAMNQVELFAENGSRRVRGTGDDPVLEPTRETMRRIHQFTRERGKKLIVLLSYPVGSVWHACIRTPSFNDSGSFGLASARVS